MVKGLVVGGIGERSTVMSFSNYLLLKIWNHN